MALQVSKRVSDEYEALPFESNSVRSQLDIVLLANNVSSNLEPQLFA